MKSSKFILHFDVNKTLLVSDKAGGVTTDKMINSILSECIWGLVAVFDYQRIEEIEMEALEKPRDWVIGLPLESWYCISTKPDPQPPLNISEEMKLAYWHYYIATIHSKTQDNDEKCKFTEDTNDSEGSTKQENQFLIQGEELNFETFKKTVTFKTITYAEFLERRQTPKELRRRLKQNFTEEGGLGFQFTPDKEKLLEALQVPTRRTQRKNNTVNEEVLISTQPSERKKEVQLLPSFFNMVNYLQDMKESQQIESFMIVFRTFGHDIPDIIEEYNAFIEDKHPYFTMSKNSLTTTSSSKTSAAFNQKIDPTRDVCKLSRKANREKRDARKQRQTELSQVNKEDLFLTATFGIDALTEGDKNSATTLTSNKDKKIENVEEFLSFLRHSLDEGRTLAISDDYFFWAECNESDDSGKLLFVEEEGSLIYNLFFDDNIERHCAHIVDVRSATAPYPAIAFSESKDKYIFKCEPYHAILDPNYFISIFDSIYQKLKNE